LIVRRARVKPCAAQRAIGGAPPTLPFARAGRAAWEARPVKYSNYYPGTVVIMLTNHAEAQYQKRCLELKADYFLSKATDWNR
jgi:CheY-like chemotaxis protein